MIQMIESLTLCNMTSATTLSWRDSGTLPFFKTNSSYLDICGHVILINQEEGYLRHLAC